MPTLHVGGRPLPSELVSGSLPLAEGHLFLSYLSETDASDSTFSDLLPSLWREPNPARSQGM